MLVLGAPEGHFTAENARAVIHAVLVIKLCRDNLKQPYSKWLFAGYHILTSPGQ
jgi:hypothetical protein